MKFETNTAVTILKPRSLTTVRAWTNDGLRQNFVREGLPADRFGFSVDTRLIGDALYYDDEGIYWARGHDDETAKALLVARALR